MTGEDSVLFLSIGYLLWTILVLALHGTKSFENKRKRNIKVTKEEIPHHAIAVHISLLLLFLLGRGGS